MDGKLTCLEQDPGGNTPLCGAGGGQDMGAVFLRVGVGVEVSGDGGN